MVILAVTLHGTKPLGIKNNGRVISFVVPCSVAILSVNSSRKALKDNDSHSRNGSSLLPYEATGFTLATISFLF